MTKNNCRYESRFDGGVLEFCLLGEIDHHRAVNVRTEMDEEICRLRPKKLILELGKIEFMDSSGLGLIMGRYSLMQKIGGEFSLRNPNERIVKIFELAGLSRMMRIESDSENDSKEVKNESK